MNVPRYPTVPGRLQAEEALLPVWSNDFLKLDPATIGLNGSPTHVRRIFAPEREKGEIVNALDGGGNEAVALMVEKLQEWDFLS
jgi:electron transfer flavoprotein beta subunit